MRVGGSEERFNAHLLESDKLFRNLFPRIFMPSGRSAFFPVMRNPLKSLHIQRRRRKKASKRLGKQNRLRHSCLSLALLAHGSVAALTSACCRKRFFDAALNCAAATPLRTNKPSTRLFTMHIATYALRFRLVRSELKSNESNDASRLDGFRQSS